MRAINHALTGAVIGTVISNPLIAGVAAFASHFVLDIIPHYDDEDFAPKQSKAFLVELIADATACLILVGILLAFHPDWLQASICAFLGTSPDLMWTPRYLFVKKHGYDPPLKNPILRFHDRIQWLTAPHFLFLEITWLAAMTSLLFTLTS